MDSRNYCGIISVGHYHWLVPCSNCEQFDCRPQRQRILPYPDCGSIPLVHYFSRRVRSPSANHLLSHVMILTISQFDYAPRDTQIPHQAGQRLEGKLAKVNHFTHTTTNTQTGRPSPWQTPAHPTRPPGYRRRTRRSAREPPLRTDPWKSLLQGLLPRHHPQASYHRLSPASSAAAQRRQLHLLLRH